METIGRVRHAFHMKGKTIKQISRELRLARNTVRSIVRGEETKHSYERKAQPLPKLGAFAGALDQMLEDNAGRPKRERLTFSVCMRHCGCRAIQAAMMRCAAMAGPGSGANR